MKFLAALIFLASMGCQSCVTTGGKTPVTTVVLTGIDCTVDAVIKEAGNHLPEVERTLLDGGWKNELIALGKDIGEDVLACIIESIVDSSDADVAASADVNARTKSARGRQWLAEKQVTFAKKLKPQGAK